MTASNDVRKAMQETNEKFCHEVIRDGRFDALSSIYTKGARIMPPGGPMVEGRAAIEGFWKAAVAGMGVTGVKLTIVDTEMAGDTVIEIGHADLQMGKDKSASVKYIVHWKQENGHWRWDKDIWNMDA